MIRRTVRTVGQIISAIALTSLVAGVFSQQLLPYLNGVIAGMLELYQVTRDVVYGGVGAAFTGIINWLTKLVPWLPAAPWFNLPYWGKDLLTLYIMVGAGMGDVVKTFTDLEQEYTGTNRWPVRLFASIFWPFSFLVVSSDTSRNFDMISSGEYLFPDILILL